MTSQDRKHQDNHTQQDDDFRDLRRDRWADERDDENRRYQGSSRDVREAWLGYGRGREDYPYREGRGRDEYRRENNIPWYRQGSEYAMRQGFDEGYFGGRNDRWDRDYADRDRFQGADRWRDNERLRSSGSFERGSRGQRYPDYHDQDRGWRGSFQHEDRPLWDRASDEVSSWFGDDEAARRRRQDQSRDERARYSGVGPKNYKRSDERIRDDVSDRLSDDHYVNAAEIEVAASNSEVTLNGFVDSRDQRRHAELIAERVSGVTHVQNNLRVKNVAQGMGQDPRHSASASAQPGGALKTGSH